MRAIERLDPRATGFAAAALRLMVEQIRSVASRRRTVGRGVLTVDIPRSVMDAQRSERVILHSSPDPDQVTFSLPSSGVRRRDGSRSHLRWRRGSDGQLPGLATP
jgi:hypothetical protein